MRADDSNIVFYIGLLLFMIAPLQFCWCINSTSANITQEREALLKLKQSFFNIHANLSILKSWEGNDYCKWEGVGCDPITLHVLNLDLRQNPCECPRVNPFLSLIFGKKPYGISSRIPKCDPCPLTAHEVNPCIMELKHLKYLDFSGINFGGGLIPEFLSSMKQLRYLNLSGCGFSGNFPHHFGNLSNLQVLDLSSNFYEFLDADNNIGWLSKLTSLKHLALNYVSLEKAYNLFQVLDTLPFLFQVELSRCGLTNTHIIPRGPVNSTFLNNVQALNLAFNHLHGPFPNAFRNLTSIRDLNLRGNNLTSVPYWLNNLHSLVRLDLSSNPFKKIEASVLSILAHMCSLRSLDLSNTNAVIGRLGPNHGNYSRCRRYNLEVLMLRENGIEDSLPFWIGNLSNLKILDLATNSFYGPIPLSFGNLLALRTLDLSGNRLNGSIPSSFGNLLALRTLYLSDNLLNGPIPLSFGNLLALRRLDLSENLLKGPIPSSFGNLLALGSLDLSRNLLNGPIPLSFGNLLALSSLRLSGNLLNGTIPTSIGSLSELTSLQLSNNQLQGSIPTTIGQLSSLRELVLSYNNLNGSIPESLGQLGNLVILSVANNYLTGIVSEIHLLNLSNLRQLQIGFNNLTVKIESNWTPSFKYLGVLGMASCNIATHFPLWLQTQELLTYLDMSNNQIISIPNDIDHILPDVSWLNLQNNLIEGSMPDSLCKMESLFVLDLSNNKLSGKIPNCWGGRNFSVFNLASNQLSGTIPSSFGNLTVYWLNLSNNSLHGEPFLVLKNTQSLQSLDLGVNKFSGKIPSSWIIEASSLKNLRLRRNLFSGDIPAVLCQLTLLQVLDLSYNNFSGSIPPCIGHLEGMVEKAATRLHIPYSPVGRTMMEAVLSMMEYHEGDWTNKDFKQVLKGNELDYTKNLKYLANIDLSNNNLIGSIPEGLTSLSGLIGLSLSHNHLSGQIPSHIQQMESLESIDFSNNNLSGHIPTNMSIMDRLGFLNLSNNNLSGPIPINDHFLTFDNQSFVGNPYLCGKPLNSPCYGADKVPTTTQEDNNGNNDKKEKVLFYFVIALGFITGFWAFFGTLLLKKNWRHAYFSYVDKVADNMYVTIMIRLRK